MHFDYIEVYKDYDNKWRWRGKSWNGRVLADSGENYVSAANLKRVLIDRSCGASTPIRVLTKSKVKWPLSV